MLRSPSWSKIQATRGACAAVVRADGEGALSTCSMVNASAKQQTGKTTETTAAQRSGVFTAARLYSPPGPPSIRFGRNASARRNDRHSSSFILLTSYFAVAAAVSAALLPSLFRIQSSLAGRLGPT